MSEREKVARWLRNFVRMINREPTNADWNEALAKIWEPEANKLLAILQPGEPVEWALISDVLNRCATVANALNPLDPIPAKIAHRELWSALNAISDEWPIDDLAPPEPSREREVQP